MSFGMLWCVSCTALADYGISCPALVSSGYPAGILWLALVCLSVILWVCSGLPWLALGILWVSCLLSSGLPWLALVCLMVCSGMSHCWLCTDDVLCKNRPCPNITLWILSIHVNLELIYEFIYTCQ